MYLSIESRKFMIFGLLFLMVSSFSLFAESHPEKKFELKLSGGISRLSGTDSEDTTDYWNRLSKISTEAAGGTFASEKSPLDWGWELTGEIVFNISPRFALSGGIGYIRGKYSSLRMTSLGDMTNSTIQTEQTAKAVPVTVGMYYILPVSSKSRFSIGVGAGYYFTSFSIFSLRENNPPYWLETETTGSGGDIGFHAGIGFEYALSRNIAIMVEGFARSAKISGFEGTRNRVDSNNWSDSLEATHYHYEQYAWTGEWLPRTGFSNEPPSGENIRNVRDYEIDFSGFTIRIGLKIKLF